MIINSKLPQPTLPLNEDAPPQNKQQRSRHSTVRWHYSQLIMLTCYMLAWYVKTLNVNTSVAYYTDTTQPMEILFLLTSSHWVQFRAWPVTLWYHWWAWLRGQHLWPRPKTRSGFLLQNISMRLQEKTSDIPSQGVSVSCVQPQSDKQPKLAYFVVMVQRPAEWIVLRLDLILMYLVACWHVRIGRIPSNSHSEQQVGGLLRFRIIRCERQRVNITY